jgi:hypothetical protein
MTTLETLKRHPRVADVTVEQGGDLIMVTLKAPWSRYGTGRADGYSKGFDAEDGYAENDDKPYTMAQNAARALHWVRHEVYNVEGR